MSLIVRTCFCLGVKQNPASVDEEALLNCDCRQTWGLSNWIDARSYHFTIHHLFSPFDFYKKIMAVPELNDILRFEAYKGEDSDDASIELSWSQALRSRSATYYILNAKNTSKGNSDTLLYIQKPIYRDEGSPDFLGKIPGAKKEGSKFSSYVIYSAMLILMFQTTGWFLSPTGSNMDRRMRRESNAF
jgi:hypothetical protein